MASLCRGFFYPKFRDGARWETEKRYKISILARFMMKESRVTLKIKIEEIHGFE